MSSSAPWATTNWKPRSPILKNAAGRSVRDGCDELVEDGACGDRDRGFARLPYGRASARLRSGARECRATRAQHLFAARVRGINHAERMAYPPARAAGS